MDSQTKNCQNCKKDFTIESDDFAFYEKMKVPVPTFCWKCRAIRRMCFRNMRQLYIRNCDATGKKIFTLMPPDNPMPVYDNDYWRSDAWDPMKYEKNYDFSNAFFEQIKELYNSVPWGIMWSMDMVNCEYSGGVSFSKNCYMCFDSGYDEDCMYNVTVLYSKKCLDSINLKDCELCYYCINTNKSYKTLFSRNCTSCVDVWFSQDCIGCTNCFGCSGLKNKSYYIFNEVYDKATYETKIADLKLDSWSGIKSAKNQAKNFWEKCSVKFYHGTQVTKSFGDYLYNGTELRNCFFVGNAQNMKHCQSVIYPPNQDSMDVTSSEGTELAYEVFCCGNGVRRSIGLAECSNVYDAYYSINCRQSNNLFGCVSLKGKEYCILNKQYTKEKYLEMIPKIIKHMNDMPYIDALGRVYKYGEFFPTDMSSYGYNQSQAFEYFPINEQEAKKQGYRWHEANERSYQITKKSSDLPEKIEEVSDEILKEVIQCEHDEFKKHKDGCNLECTRAFKITLQELQFYRQMDLPLPRLCFNCRHIDRVAWRNQPKLYKRKCMKPGCQNEFETSYAPDRPEIVYCEACYNQEVA
ncbi:MAG: hypothetical protein A2312_01875 [Candidatus Staskawiczbacteria bacterium RIFOXYB2_FULL_32_9]|uniref:Uncharacterized protein n=1 Tax=Candidatus Staskawiczbacteria bacterium RIFOXYD1_FULL_32_13 TaxID=1802234 RepID=A0A1G2JKU5_9BACT|nr:MAG: hypothetical protein UR22_C0001G0101 [Parcubacteria group bacterium GW2011_GWC2_32_10]OGZ77331.1 MAG: hypothetical protein A2256_03735 [Candidatus Staskawiczbacteria bacterium RIFOXYA2_FULL_32_7]OGZ77819.1 MAG: hypothetical protein A2360_04445 [Candidatus Staskawiczbacteria bacterium RIFOXYB1_FULL_32_11]OGZ82118.1 MAG: hypothetical protein A2312_01875 [Candidatus Staskawiczbacteria bacterium RIFOXYB2_FULL_32_9]OGZ87282.1 MAG: hypothetical protein A2463_02885 [Candidatus Staskawiczbacter